MQMIAAILFLLVPTLATVAEETPLARAQKIVRPGDDYRLIQGSSDRCPGEGTVFWRKHASLAPYLMLTPSQVLMGFDKSGRVPVENKGASTECGFEREIKVTDSSIDYTEYDVCKDQKMNRELKRVITVLPENKLKYEVSVKWAGQGSNTKTFNQLNCVLVRKTKVDR